MFECIDWNDDAEKAIKISDGAYTPVIKDMVKKNVIALYRLTDGNIKGYFTVAVRDGALYVISGVSIGNGVGFMRTLFNELESVAPTIGIKKIYCASANKTIRKFLTKRGYKSAGLNDMRKEFNV